MAGRSTNTMVEFIERTIQDVAQAKLLADADLPFLIELETSLIDEYKNLSGMSGMEQQGLIPPQPTMPAMPGPSALGAGGVRGVAPGAGMPNPDELRRLLSQGA